ncbi:uncharacterized protein LOC106473507 [Limulus polyphemus]|uniref:Uncharacterized protein LOC106473507 n=1 Tax=Limulus polyphemus TaxID=6850 RepID=A0ABM1TP35_LIMPO|nr:uncharacterized protein LOC106473507 [Limulus polyphemus]
MDDSSAKFKHNGLGMSCGQSEGSGLVSQETKDVTCLSQFPFITGDLPRYSKRKHNTENLSSANRNLGATKFIKASVGTSSETKVFLDLVKHNGDFLQRKRLRTISDPSKGELKKQLVRPTILSLKEDSPPNVTCYTREIEPIKHFLRGIHGRFSESDNTKYPNQYLNSAISNASEESSVFSENAHENDLTSFTHKISGGTYNLDSNHGQGQGFSRLDTMDTTTREFQPIVSQDSGFASLADNSIAISDWSNQIDTNASECLCEEPLPEEVFFEDMVMLQNLNKLSSDGQATKDAISYKQKTTDSSIYYCSNRNNLSQEPTCEIFKEINTKETVSIEGEVTREEQRNLDIQYCMIADKDGDRALLFCFKTPLHLAVIVGNQHLVEILLEEDASPKLRDRYGNTCLHLAVKYKRLECLRVLLSNRLTRQIVNSLNYDGYSALHVAVTNRAIAAIKYLVKANCDIDVQDGKSGRTPLFHAVMNNDKSIVQLLLKIGASPNAVDYSGISPLEAAVLNEKEDIANLLESRNLTINFVRDRTNE